MNLEDIIRLWHKTQIGNMHKCRENQTIFADIMWTLYKKLEKNKNLDLPKYQCFGDEVI